MQTLPPNPIPQPPRRRRFRQTTEPRLIRILRHPSALSVRPSRQLETPGQRAPRVWRPSPSARWTSSISKCRVIRAWRPRIETDQNAVLLPVEFDKHWQRCAGARGATVCGWWQLVGCLEAARARRAALIFGIPCAMAADRLYARGARTLAIFDKA